MTFDGTSTDGNFTISISLDIEKGYTDNGFINSNGTATIKVNDQEESDELVIAEYNIFNIGPRMQITLRFADGSSWQYYIDQGQKSGDSYLHIEQSNGAGTNFEGTISITH